MEFLESFDQGAIHPWEKLQQPTGVAFMTTVTRLGDPIVILILLALGVAFLLVRHQRREAMVLSLAVLAGLGLTWLAKGAVDRPRPNVRWSPLEMPATGAFPSGHALLATVFFVTLALTGTGQWRGQFRRRALVYLAVLIAFLVGVSRLYCGVNHVTDVLAGWLLGSTLALIGAALLVDKDQSTPDNAKS